MQVYHCTAVFLLISTSRVYLAMEPLGQVVCYLCIYIIHIWKAWGPFMSVEVIKIVEDFTPRHFFSI